MFQITIFHNAHILSLLLIPFGLSCIPDTEDLKCRSPISNQPAPLVWWSPELLHLCHLDMLRKRIWNLTNYSYSTEQKNNTNFSLIVMLVVSVGLQDVNLSHHFWVGGFPLIIVRFFLWWWINCRTNSMQLWYPQYPAAELSEQVHTFHFLFCFVCLFVTSVCLWVFALCCCHSENARAGP